jgi:hypothetical protein
MAASMTDAIDPTTYFIEVLLSRLPCSSNFTIGITRRRRVAIIYIAAILLVKGTGK